MTPTERKERQMIEITDDEPMIEILVQLTRGDETYRVKRLYTQDEWRDITRWGVESALSNAAEKCAEQVTDGMGLYY